jgi:hypothetical protein
MQVIRFRGYDGMDGLYEIRLQSAVKFLVTQFRCRTIKSHEKLPYKKCNRSVS